jgi:hypothetical protein
MNAISEFTYENDKQSCTIKIRKEHDIKKEYLQKEKGSYRA